MIVVIVDAVQLLLPRTRSSFVASAFRSDVLEAEQSLLFLIDTITSRWRL
jgi:hypothetical protein